VGVQVEREVPEGDALDEPPPEAVPHQEEVIRRPAS
jgi:hypothetical protein